jgi:hypothetical protein
MNPRPFLLVAALVYTVSTSTSPAPVGYVNLPFAPGNTLFVNPLDNGTGNTISSLFPGAVPEGTMISLWNPVSLSFDTTSIFSAGAWSMNLALNPGTGAQLQTPTIFTNTFVGYVVTRDGGPFGEPPFALPPLFSGPNGLYLQGDILPVGSTGTDVFLNVIGRLPNVGEQFIDGFSGTSTYLGGGLWSGPIPSLNVGEAGFFNIGPIPEPSATAILLLGLALLARARRRA